MAFSGGNEQVLSAVFDNPAMAADLVWKQKIEAAERAAKRELGF